MVDQLAKTEHAKIESELEFALLHLIIFQIAGGGADSIDPDDLPFVALEPPLTDNISQLSVIRLEVVGIFDQKGKGYLGE